MDDLDPIAQYLYDVTSETAYDNGVSVEDLIRALAACAGLEITTEDNHA